MKKTRHTVPLLTAFLMLCFGTAISGGNDREIGRTTESEVNVVLSSSFGTVIISKGEPGKIFVAKSVSDNSPPIDLSYTVRNRVGYLEVSLGEDFEENGSGHWSIKGGEWQLKFCDAIPLSFDIELGLGKGDFDLSGLMVKDFTLSSGASEVAMNFDEENRSLIERMTIESGVSKFTGSRLGNANFRHFRFEGGVGTYSLDFSGNLNREADVDVNVGLGVLTLVVPGALGARLSYEKSWISRLECDKRFQLVNDGEYVTTNYNNTDGRLNIRLESGLGSIMVVRE